MMSLVMSARQVRLHRLWLRVDTVGTGESLTCTPCGSLTSARALEPERCLLIVSAASGPLQVCVRTHARVLTFMDVFAARDNVQSHTSIRPGTSDSLMLQCTGHALSLILSVPIAVNRRAMCRMNSFLLNLVQQSLS